MAEATATKQCPLCGETILSVAKKCKHCNSMLDGSSPQSVTVKGFDPFAQYHTEIQGKKQGKLSLLGYLGMLVVGPFIVLGGVALIKEGQDALAVTAISMGLGMSVGCYFWARR